MAAQRGELGRQLPLRGPLKALEADIHHANAMADAIQRNYGGACVQMRLSFSSLAPFFLYFIQWLDCGCCYALPSYLGLFHILICKVYADGDSSVSTYERRASLREFYAIIYPILQQLESSLIERDMKGKGRCKDIVSRRRMEDWKRLSGKDVEREDECGICMETCTKMVLPNCSHAMCIKCYRDWYKRSESCPFCRGSLKRIRSRDLWVLTNYNDVIDPANLERENVTVVKMGDVPDAEKKWLQDPNGNESPPTRGIEDRVDCISYLPDNILGDIISLLPTKDDARTKVLASKWSHFWRSAPLNIDHCDLQEISNIVNTHPGLTRRFCIPVSCLRSDIDTVDALLQSATLNGPQELEFRLPDLDLKWSSYPPPPVSTFRFSSTLRVVSFGGCDLPDIIFDHLQLPNLQQLTVSNATISEGTLHAMLAGCPALEILLLKYNEGFRCLRINCPYLKSIGIHSRFSRRWKGLTLEEVLIEDAPCLERLIIFDQINRLRISVILAPKLETLGCISEYLCKTALTLGSTMFQFQGIRSVGMRAMVPMHTVKVLSISTFFLRLDDVIISFIGCFPCLEKLYIQSRSPVHRNRRCREHKNLIKTFGLHLKHIVLSNYWGTREQSEFATFFLLNARILESMKLVAPAGFYPDNDWIEEQRRELKLENSASRGAKVTFTNYACRHGLMHVFRANDLSVADPFDCSC